MTAPELAAAVARLTAFAAKCADGPLFDVASDASLIVAALSAAQRERDEANATTVAAARDRWKERAEIAEREGGIAHNRRMEAVAALAAQQATNRALREALLRHGHHLAECWCASPDVSSSLDGSGRLVAVAPPANMCSCGLTAALAVPSDSTALRELMERAASEAVSAYAGGDSFSVRAIVDRILGEKATKGGNPS